MRFAWVLLAGGCLASDPPASEYKNERLRQLHEEALPYYQASGQFDTFIGAHGVTIAYARFTHPGARAAIVFAPGRGEGTHTFAPLYYDLRDQPYDLFIIDHRGQGASGRMIADPLKGYVDDFQSYIDDYDQLIRTVVEPQHYDHVFGVAHSMGGAITLGYVMEHPDTFEALVLSSPMLEINTGTISEDVTLSYATSVPPEDTVPVGGDGTMDTPYAGNYLTNDVAELDVLNEIDRLYPERRIGRATYQWLAQSIREDRYLRAHAELVQKPVLLFQAGADGVVVAGAETTFCAQLAHCERIEFMAAQHELFFAEDVVRGALMDRMAEYLGSMTR